MGRRERCRSIGRCLRRWTLVCGSMVLGGCVSTAPPPTPVVRTRQDGTVVRCSRPDPALLNDERAHGLLAAFPNIVEHLLVPGNLRRKLEAIYPAASTPELLEILTYRVCLVYGEGVITSAVYEDWERNVRPGLTQWMRPG